MEENQILVEKLARTRIIKQPIPWIVQIYIYKGRTRHSLNGILLK